MRALLVVVCTVLGPAAALAAPSFEVLDRGIAVEVIARDVKAARTAVVPVRSRLEVEIVGAARGEPLVPSDRGVKLVELAGSPRVLSVKLPLDRTQVKELARHAQAIQVGADLHLLFPRAVPPRDAAVILPEPTIPPGLATTPAPAIGPRPPAPAASETAEPPAKPEAALAPPKPAAPPAPALSSPTTESTGLSIYVALGLAAIGAGVWLVRKRRNKVPATSSIDVIAQRSLGPKAKVVWLAAGGREMVLAVTQQQVRMLGQWRKEAEPPAGLAEATSRLPRARTHHDASEPTAPASSSVSGILKLRARGSEPGIAPPPGLDARDVLHALDDDVKTGDLDADALWAKEILAATTRQSGRR